MSNNGRDAQDMDSLNVADWMERRSQDVARLWNGAEARGHEIWGAAARSGRDVVAPRESDVRALGAQSISAPRAMQAEGGNKAIQRGGKAILSDEEIAGIIFNETRSLSGADLQQARTNLAHAVMNGDEALGQRRPKTAPSKVTVPEAEREAFEASKAAVVEARRQRAAGVDPTNGGIHFNLRGQPSTNPFMGYPLQTQTGPFKNSYPSKDLPGDGVYANTYQD